MQQCNNCKTPLGCTCAKRIASDGTSCCATCVATYEAKIQAIKNATPPKQP